MNADIKAAKHETGLYKNGFVIEPISEAGVNACKQYKGVKMNKFFIPNSLIDSFTKLVVYKGLTIEFNNLKQKHHENTI